MVSFKPVHIKRGSAKGNSREAARTVRARLLLVEGDFLVRFALGEFLRAKGYIVFQAMTSSQAKHVFETVAPLDILLAEVDLDLGEDAFDLARWVRDHHPRSRILFLSGDNKLTPEQECLCDRLLIGKPYSYGRVADEVAYLLRPKC